MIHFENISKDKINERNELLQKTLRDLSSTIEIEKEYPLALSSKDHNKSFCGIHENRIVTHTNLLEKSVIKDDALKTQVAKVGLIGNVATSPSMRGKGFMKETLSFIEKTAKDSGHKAVILWSDLDDFYQKLGYRKISTEFRYSFKHSSSPLSTNESFDTQILSTSEINKSILDQLRSLRRKSEYTLDRTNEEFSQLLGIPETYLIVSKKQNVIEAFAIIGKGADFIGVIHEWGFSNYEGFSNIVDLIFKITETPELTVLSPNPVEDFVQRRITSETHSMGFAKIFDPDFKDTIEKLYIWGLDSI
jgi:N-acetylglutamate synthase-like GNAT family acetyltransferase